MVWLVGGVITVKVLKTQEHDCNIHVSLFLFLANKVLFIKSIKINVCFFKTELKSLIPLGQWNGAKIILSVGFFVKGKYPYLFLKN